MISHVAVQGAWVAALLTTDVAGEQRRSSSSTGALSAHPTESLSRQAACIEPVYLGQVLHELVPVGQEVAAGGEDAGERGAGDVLGSLLQALAHHLARAAGEKAQQELPSWQGDSVTSQDLGAQRFWPLRFHSTCLILNLNLTPIEPFVNQSLIQ